MQMDTVRRARNCAGIDDLKPYLLAYLVYCRFAAFRPARILQNSGHNIAARVLLFLDALGINACIQKQRSERGKRQ